jgi:hypothetical protein
VRITAIATAWVLALATANAVSPTAAYASGDTNQDIVCPPYSSDDPVLDETVAEGAVLALELTNFILGAVADAIEEHGEEVEAGGADPVQGVAGAAIELTAEPVKIAASVVAGTIGAAKTAKLVLETINKVADACRTERHQTLQDELIKAAIRHDLSVTTTPVFAFVMPESEEGFLDRADVGVKDIVHETIEKMESTGQCGCSSANSYYDQAVTALGQAHYKTAYKLFRQAYVLAFSN